MLDADGVLKTCRKVKDVPCCSRTTPTISGKSPLLFSPPHPNLSLQHILRLLNTNVDGKRKVMYALTEIKGVGRRYSNLVCKKADVDLNKRYAFVIHTLQTLQITSALLVLEN